MIRKKIIMAEIICLANGKNNCLDWDKNRGCTYEEKCPYKKVKYSQLDPKGEEVK